MKTKKHFFENDYDLQSTKKKLPPTKQIENKPRIVGKTELMFSYPATIKMYDRASHYLSKKGNLSTFLSAIPVPLATARKGSSAI